MKSTVFFLIALVFFMSSPLFAEDRPVIPPTSQIDRWVIEQIPANLTVVYINGLRVAYPVVSSTSFVFDQAFKEKDGLWYFSAPCTSFQRIVRPTPTAWRQGDQSEWQPYINKTFEYTNE